MLTPKEIADAAIKVGNTKGKLTAMRAVLLGVFAGIFIALAGVAATFGNVYVGKLAGACIFPAGLIMVVIAGSELFTGNNLMFVALLNKKLPFSKLLKNWSLVFLGNFLGAILVAILTVYSGTLDSVSESVISAATTKVSLSFIEALFRGILCNFLVCIAVWMSFAADTVQGKAIAIFFPVMLFVLCGFEHSVANMYYIPAGMLEAVKTGAAVDGLNIGTFLLNNLLPVTLGNIIGGAGMVGAGYWLIYKKK